METGEFTIPEGNKLRYYCTGAGNRTFVLLHAQGTSSESYFEVAKQLGKTAKVILIDCYGHGGSSHNAELYQLDKIGDDIHSLLQHLTSRKITLVGHSSGGLIAAYIAATYPCCEKLILEDPPFFASFGKRRFKTYNYLDLSTVCHEFLHQTQERDFVLYYFAHQYAWNFFPEKDRERIQEKLTQNARKYRAKHPDKPLKVLFWPKSALEAFKGMNEYDPHFGEAFYTDSFHAQIDYEVLLQKITCPTVFMKAETNIGEDGIQMCALTEEDANRVSNLIPECRIVHFPCGHGIHVEKKKEFLKILQEQ